MPGATVIPPNSERLFDRSCNHPGTAFKFPLPDKEAPGATKGPVKLSVQKVFQALSGGDCKTAPLLAALFQKYKPDPFAPALDETEAVGTIVPHCELFVAIGALGN